jgi:predicted protein tyrosine phosphatase
MIYVFDHRKVQDDWFPDKDTIAIRCLSSKYNLMRLEAYARRAPRLNITVPKYDYLRGSYVAVLPLVFDDIRNPDEDDPKYVIFRESTAKKIKRFVEANRGKFEDIMVHCDAGLSRSTAVGIALGEHYRLEYDKEDLKHRHDAGPNNHVYETLMRVLEKN